MAMVHKHRCRKCQTVWEHGAGCQGSSPAHICPTPGCGQEERGWYEGDKLATYVTNCVTKKHAAVASAACCETQITNHH